jgi:hypothetical protein
LRGFLEDVLKFLALQLVLLIGIECAYQACVAPEQYLAAFRDKDRNLRALPAPRVLLVGGSSFAFGVNSRLLERGLERPTLNLGLNAGLGLNFMLTQAESHAAAGDLLIVSPEYNLFGLHQVADSRVLLQLLSVAPSAARYVSAHEVPGLFDNGLSLLSARLRALRHFLRYGPAQDIYRYASFDEHGDVVAHQRLSTHYAGGKAGALPLPEAVEQACARLAIFRARVSARGARALLAPVPTPREDLAPQAAVVAQFWPEVGRKTGIPVLGVDLFYPRELFFDSGYHLTWEGRRLRTRSLLAALTAQAETGKTGDPR